MNNINNFTNNIPHRENYDNFVQVQSLQLMSVTDVDSYSPRDITQVQNDSVIVNYDTLNPQKCIRQINELSWRIGLLKNYGKEFILIQNTMYSNMQIHFIVKDQESQKYKKWYLSVSEDKPIVEDMKFFRKNENDLWEYLKGVENDWIPYNGGEFSDEEINFARRKN